MVSQNRIFPTEEQAIALLKKYAANEESFNAVYSHVSKVQEVALKFAEKIPSANKEIIKIGALLHDIGRFVCPPPSKDNAVKHAIAGADILRNERVDEIFAKICENHIGVGISKQDIIEQNLPLPHQDFIPTTTEEKIVAHADNLVFGDKEGTEKMVEDRFAKELGPKYRDKVRKFHEEMHKLMASK